MTCSTFNSQMLKKPWVSVVANYQYLPSPALSYTYSAVGFREEWTLEVLIKSPLPTLAPLCLMSPQDLPDSRNSNALLVICCAKATWKHQSFVLKFCSPAFEILGYFVFIDLIGVTSSCGSQTFSPHSLFKCLEITEDPNELLFLRVIFIDIYHIRNENWDFENTSTHSISHQSDDVITLHVAFGKFHPHSWENESEKRQHTLVLLWKQF